MQILPAIDLLGGQCVRLKQGVEKTARVYNHDPVQQAIAWEQQGGHVLHIVNLDGAFGRAVENVQAIEKILNAVACPVELGGGIRRMEDIEHWLNVGVTRVILGTVAVTNPKVVDQAVQTYGPEKIIVGLDGRENKVAIEGWEKQTNTGICDLAVQMKQKGVKRIIYTDVSRDGELVGPNIRATDTLSRETGMNMIASGGFSRLEHFDQLYSLKNPYIEGAIVGTALYENKLDLADLIKRYGD